MSAWRAMGDSHSPAAAREVLTDAQRADETVLLGVRLADGMPLADVPPERRAEVAGLVADGLVDGPAVVRDRRIRLTLRGRLLADAVVRRLVSG